MKFKSIPKPPLNKALRILLVTNGFILMAAAMLGPILALFVEEVGGSILEAGLAAAIYAVVGGITTLVMGSWADRMKESELIVATGYLLMGIGFFLFLFVDSVMGLFLVQVLIGFAEAVYSPAFDAIYSDHLTKGSSGVEWGAWESMNYFVMTAGAALGGFVASEYGFDPIFVVMSALAVAAAGYIFFLPRKVL